MNGAPIESLPGIGPVSGRALRARGFETAEDLLLGLPTGYEDLRCQTPIVQLVAGMVQLTSGQVVSCRMFGPKWRRGMEVRLEAEGEGLRLVFFRAYKGLAERYRIGQVVAVSGRVDRGKKGVTIAHPKLEASGAEAAEFSGGIRPRYQAVQGVKASGLTKARGAALQQMGAQIGVLPIGLEAPGEGMTLAAALRKIHAPSSDLEALDLSRMQERRSAAHRRVIFERVIRWVAARHVRDADDRTRQAPVIHSDGAMGEALGFELTDDQRGAIAEIRDDIAQRRPMRRLLHGEVGAGKTAVAFLAARDAVRAGGLVAIMAPTSVLAEHLFTRLRSVGVGLGVKPALLLGTMNAAERRNVVERAHILDVNVLVGTHMLASPSFQLPDIALAVIDEQQRFGVAQRLRLVRPGGEGQTPHLLAMSATPIPRSLALALCGELEVSRLRSRPSGGGDIHTRLLSYAHQDAAVERIVKEVSAGRRVFVVCARIDDDPAVGVRGVEAVRRDIGDEVGDAETAAVHGRQAPEERRRAMKRFESGCAKVLVGSSVIEVGIDVPDVNLMVVHNAERFGLSQLHQLRGRVGRRGEKAECWLIHPEEPASNTMERLKILADTGDGFEIAEQDLRLRGAGHYLGVSQSGGPGLEGIPFHEAGPLVQDAVRQLEPLFTQDPRLERPEHEALRRAADRSARAVVTLIPDDAA